MKENMKRILGFTLAVAIILSGLTINPAKTQAAETSTYLWVEDYDTTVVAREGEKYTDLVKRLQPIVKVREDGKVKYASYILKEAGQYVHAKKGKAKVTFIYKNMETSLTVKVNNSTRKLNVKVTGRLYEKQVLTMKSLKKVIKVTNMYRGGTEANFKGYVCKQIGKEVKANKKGYQKITISNGKKKVSVSVKVLPIKRIHLEQTIDSLTEGSNFSEIEAAIRKATIIKAHYSGGVKKVLNTYTVTAAPKVTGKSYLVTFKCGKFSITRSIPVVKKPTPTPVPVKKVEVSASVEGEGTALVNGKNIDKVDTGSEVTFKAVAKEGYEFKYWKRGNKIESTESTYKVIANENMALVAVFEKIERTLTLKNTSTSTVTMNGTTVRFTDGVASETFDLNAAITLRVRDSDDERFTHWANEETNEILSTDRTYVHILTENITIIPVFEHAHTVRIGVEGGKCKATFADEELLFVNDVAEVKIVAGRYPLDIVPGDDFNFVGAVDETGKTLTTNLLSELPVTGNMNITLKFSEKEKFVKVTYQNKDGQIYLSDSVAIGESMAPPTDNMQRPNQQFVGWILDDVLYSGTLASSEFLDEEGNSLDDAIKRKTAARENVTIFSQYVEEEKKTFTVTTLPGGVVRKYGDETEGTTTLEVEDGTRIELIAADILDGKNFSGWFNATTGTLIAQTATYDKYTVHSDVTFEARYSEEPIKPEPRVFFYGNKIEIGADKYNVYIANELPEGYTKIEWGIMFTPNGSDGISDEMMVLENVDNVNIKRANVDNSKVSMTISSKLPATSMKKKFRIYAEVESATGTEIIYSEEVLEALSLIHI